MKPVIVACKRQRREVNRLVDYCRRLDGTEVAVIEAEERGEPYPHRNNSAFHQCARRGEAFIWMEPDSIPLKAGWAKKLAAEFKRCGKPILISSDTNPPHDLVGGIGVYGEETRWLIPGRIAEGGFDGWMVKHLAPLVARTPLIQHSYGVYTARGDMERRHAFPKDSGILRPGAVIFHADPSQSLIGKSEYRGKTFCHTGDIGDAIAALPVIRALGGGRLVFRNHPYSVKEKQYREIKGGKFDAIRPLIEAQSYIESVEYDETCPVDVDFTHFRESYQTTKTLTEAHAAHVKAGRVSMEPWLKVEPSLQSAGKVIVARSARYHNEAFPWKRLAHKNRGRMLFVGLPDEHAAFQRAAGCQVEHARTRDFLEVARLIAGSELFIGNQSSPCWVAMGLGHPLIQETSSWNPDSMVLRDNARFVAGAEIP